MLGRKTEIILDRAVRYAVEREHECFTLEHVLWSILADPEMEKTIAACGGNPVRIKTDLENYMEREIPKVLPRDEGAQANRANSDSEEEYFEHPFATQSIQRLIQRALFYVQSSGKEEIQPEDLLVALFQAKDSKALFILTRDGIERLSVLSYLSEGNPPHAQFTPAEKDSVSPPDSGPSKSADKPSEDFLLQYTVNLNEKALAGDSDLLIGRQSELDRIIQILCRRRKNNPLLVGEPGIGKTALVEGLAHRIVHRAVPSILENTVIYSLDLSSLLAGAKFRGDFEQRFKKVMTAIDLQKQKGQNPVLFIDEIHSIVGAGSVGGGSLDVANYLKPILDQGKVRCMGSTTYRELRAVFEKDQGLARRFQKVELKEPSQEETLQILSGVQEQLEKHHSVKYSPEALRAAVELSSKHILDRFLPDKALDVVDEAGAKARLSQISEIQIAEIEAVIAQMARIPTRSLSSHQKGRLKNLKSDLQLSIFGQNHAIDALVTSIQLARSGLRSGERPVGSFLFCGPTGVGKTELSKQLAHCLGVPFIRLDMSEYHEAHSVSRLIGAPPGYVGFDQPGLLTDSLLKNPYSVVLFDEIEKAHPEVWNLFLQVMDHGTLTDNTGKKADFRNAILIMTSNVGSRDLEKRPMGMIHAVSGPLRSAHKDVERTFTPEFRNRLDSVVYFHALTPQAIKQVVEKQIIELENQLLAKNVELTITPELSEWLSIHGYNRLMGARPLTRLIQEKIKRPLSEEILFGRLEEGGSVKLTIEGNEIGFQYDDAPPALSRLNRTPLNLDIPNWIY